jgi:hypothetical protein
MAAVVGLIWAKREAEYFCGQHWTGQISLIRHDKLGFRRRSMEPLIVLQGRQKAPRGVLATSHPKKVGGIQHATVCGLKLK